MKKLALIFSFLFILIGCGGGGGNSNNKFVDISQANLNDILATYKSSSYLNHYIIAYLTLPPSNYNTNDGKYDCNMGGTYSVTTKNNQKIFEYNNCKVLNVQTRVEVTFKGTIKMSNNGSHREYIDFFFNRFEDIKFSGIIDHNLANGTESYKLNLSSVLAKFNNGVTVELKDAIFEYYNDKHLSTESINSTATSSKLDGYIKVETISKIKQSQKCPTSGEVKISGSKDYLYIKYRKSMNIDVYLNGDNSVITSFNDCDDFPKY